MKNNPDEWNEMKRNKCSRNNVDQVFKQLKWKNGNQWTQTEAFPLKYSARNDAKKENCFSALWMTWYAYAKFK